MKRACKSPFEFMNFLKENDDPCGVKEKGLQKYTMTEIATHTESPSIWTVYQGKVYDITMYIDYHPGGKEILQTVAGKDCTLQFAKYHNYLSIDNFLGKFQIGTVKGE